MKKEFILKKLFNKENEEIRKLKQIKKKIKQIKKIEDLEAIEEELVEIGVIEESELLKIEKLKNKKRKKTQKEYFEERVRCNLEIINRTIIEGKQFKIREEERKKEEYLQDKGERLNDKIKKHDREERAERESGRNVEKERDRGGRTR